MDLEHRPQPTVAAIKIPPIGSDVAPQQLAHLRRQPCGHMHSVGHRADRYLYFWKSSPCVLPQPPRHRAVEATYANRLVCESQRRVRCAEPLARITWLLPTEVHEPVERDANLVQIWVEEVPDKARVEVIAAGRDRRMRREYDSRSGNKPRLLERHPA